MLKGQLPETVLHLGRWDVFASDPDRRRGTGQDFADQFQQAIGIVIGIALCQQGIIDLLPHALLDLSIVRGMDRWISIAKISLIMILITCFPFREVCTSGFGKS